MATKPRATNHLRLVLIGAAILLVAAMLRLVNLNSLPVFADESIYVRWAQIMRAESTLRFLPLSDGKQPLYMWAVIPFLKLITDPLIAGRLLSALAGLGTTVGVGVAAFLLFKKKRLSFIASGLWATIPYAVFFERMALADALLTMWVVWTFNFSIIALTHLRWDFSMLAGFTLGFAWLTKSPAIFSLALIPSLLLLSPRPGSKIHLLKIAGLIFTSYVIAFSMYNILRLGPEFHMIALRNKDYIYPWAEIARHPLSPLVPHLRDSLVFFLYLATPIGLLFAVTGLFVDRFAHWKQRLVLAAWWLLPIVAQSAVAITLTARYLLFTLPFAVILAAHTIEHIGDKTNKHRLVYAALALVVMPSLWYSWQFWFAPQSAPLPRIERTGYLEEWTAGVGLREVSGFIRQATNSGPVLVGSEGFFGTPFDGLGMYLNGVTNVRVIGVGIWIDSVSEKLTNALADNRVFLVVNSSRFHIQDFEGAGLKLINSYPKATSPAGGTEHLLFFEVLPKK